MKSLKSIAVALCAALVLAGCNMSNQGKGAIIGAGGGAGLGAIIGAIAGNTAVGAVIGGICYERFGLFVVTIISGAALVLTSIGMIYFMQNNTQVREAPLSISGYLSVFGDSRVSKFLNSSFLMLGVAIAFVFFFIPNYLGNVGISLPTTSFYFLVCGFTACFVCGFLKHRFAHILTSRTRVLIQAASTVVGLFVFALLPSANTLVITSAFLGIALGIHDYYYI